MALLQTSQITGSGDLLLPGGEINDTGTDLNIVGTNAVTLQTSAGTAISIPGGSLNTTIYGSAQIRGGLLELGEHGVAGGSLVSDGDMVYNSAYNDASGNNGDHIFKTFSGGTEVARFKYDKSAVFAGDVTINGGNDCLIVTGLNATMKLVAASNDWTRIKFHPDNASSSKQWLIGAHKDSPYQFLFQNALGTTLSLDGNAHNATFAGAITAGGKIRTSYNGDAGIEVDSANSNDAYIDLASGAHNMTIRNTGGDSFGGLEFHYEGAEKMRLQNDGTLVLGRPNEAAGYNAKICAWASGTAGHAAISARAGGNSDGLHINAGNNNFGSSQYAIKVTDENSDNVVFGVVKANTSEYDDVYDVTNKGSINIDGGGSHNSPNDAKLYITKNSANDWFLWGNSGNDNYGFKVQGNGSYALAVYQHDTGYRARISYDGYVYSTDGNIHDIDSDERLKEDVSNADSQWQLFKDLPLQKFKWIDRRHGDDYSHGWIAQEVQKKYPDLVEKVPQSKEDIDAGLEDEEYLTVKTGIIQRLGLKALQEAMEKIETLEAKVEELSDCKVLHQCACPSCIQRKKTDSV